MFSCRVGFEPEVQRLKAAQAQQRWIQRHASHGLDDVRPARTPEPVGGIRADSAIGCGCDGGRGAMRVVFRSALMVMERRAIFDSEDGNSTGRLHKTN